VSLISGSGVALLESKPIVVSSVPVHTHPADTGVKASTVHPQPETTKIRGLTSADRRNLFFRDYDHIIWKPNKNITIISTINHVRATFG
jgi:hypothetical protein